MNEFTLGFFLGGLIWGSLGIIAMALIIGCNNKK